MQAALRRWPTGRSRRRGRRSRPPRPVGLRHRRAALARSPPSRPVAGGQRLLLGEPPDRPGADYSAPLLRAAVVPSPSAASRAGRPGPAPAGPGRRCARRMAVAPWPRRAKLRSTCAAPSCTRPTPGRSPRRRRARRRRGAAGRRDGGGSCTRAPTWGTTRLHNPSCSPSTRGGDNLELADRFPTVAVAVQHPPGVSGDPYGCAGAPGRAPPPAVRARRALPLARPQPGGDRWSSYLTDGPGSPTTCSTAAPTPGASYSGTWISAPTARWPSTHRAQSRSR